MIFLGKIIKSRGNKGEVVLSPSPQFQAYDPAKGDSVVLKSAKYEKAVTLDYIKEIRGAVTCKFSEINSMNDAFRIINYDLHCHGTETPEPENDQNDQIIDFKVIDMENQVWGYVKHLENYGTNQILEVESDSGDTIYVPFADGIVESIDNENLVIRINPPDGLKALNKETPKDKTADKTGTGNRNR